MRTRRANLLLFFSLLASSPLLALSSGPPYSCDASDPSTKTYAFCKASLPIEQRVQDLVSRLNLNEKISQLGDDSPAIPRLGVPAFKWWTEALHGMAYGGKGSIHWSFSGIFKATSFPQVITTAASFNPQLWYKIGEAISTEARGIYNNGQLEGLTLWGPNVNLFRDPRWGRGQETPGEDPLHASKYATMYIRGLQGDSFEGGQAKALKTSACCKHFTAYDLEKWGSASRYTFNAVVTAQDLEDTFQPPFKSCVQDGHASCLMCPFNRVNGVAPCGDYNFLTKIAKEQWGLDGYIASDCDAVGVMVGMYAGTPENASAVALKAGMDVDCGTHLQKYSASALGKKMITEADIDRALRNQFAIRMRLGLFDGNPLQQQKYGSIGKDKVCAKEHQDLALQAALEGIVLLKNTANILPLSKAKVSSLAVIGPNANNASILIGNYQGPPCISVTPLDALRNYVSDTKYVAGCSSTACNSGIAINQAAQLASSLDYVVLFMGLSLDQEREDFDRSDLLLPGSQQDLITNVAKVAKNPVILVLLCGGPVDVSFAKTNPKIGAILWAGYPGQAGGPAIAQVLFGEYNPGGKLPVTWYPKDYTTQVPMTNMNMRADSATKYPGRTYRFYQGETVFPFGYGLSYSNYSHEFVSTAKTTLKLQGLKTSPATNLYEINQIRSKECQNLNFKTTVKVTNHGSTQGRKPVLLFLRWPNETNGRPRKQLIDFTSVLLKAGETAQVGFAVSPCEHLSRATKEGKRVIDTGSHFLMVEEKEIEITVA
ncbi:Glycosyl hydrolase family protein [Rhynchospora pubera]|uniref:Glycosyl hydrolase family protein n=1 Tax=Rhynchospora pubera TaxID=906938 RepID=A0AAV8HDP4_9POAL|nr:Glycosyl hydrolase family protein [Rhynchospora pubera]